MIEPNTNPAVEMIRRIQKQMLERMQQGDLRYRQDRQTLAKHLTLAGEIGDPVLEGEILQVIGLVENEIGNYESAEKHWDEAYAAFKSTSHKSSMGQVKNNLGELYFQNREMDRALEAYLEARALAEEAHDRETIMRAESNLGMLWLLKGDNPMAHICFSLVIAVTEIEAWHHVLSIVNARRGLAEVYLARGDFVSAWQEVNEAEQLAQGRQLNLQLAQIHLTKAHIAEKDPQTPGAAEYYYASARDGLRNLGNQRGLARTLMNEAQYYAYKGRVEEAIDLALEARDIFVRGNLETDMQLSETFILELASRLGTA